jgi:uncharacterized OB-fold protein
METGSSAERRFLLPEENDGQAALLGNSCGNCGTKFFPARSVCPHCWDTGILSPYRFCGPGKLYAASVIRVAPAGFQQPYAVGLVDLPEGVRIMAQLEVDPSEWNRLSPGLTMELCIGVIREDESGQQMVGYKFRSAGEESGGG